MATERKNYWFASVVADRGLGLLLEPGRDVRHQAVVVHVRLGLGGVQGLQQGLGEDAVAAGCIFVSHLEGACRGDEAAVAGGGGLVVAVVEQLAAVAGVEPDDLVLDRALLQQLAQPIEGDAPVGLEVGIGGGEIAFGNTALALQAVAGEEEERGVGVLRAVGLEELDDGRLQRLGGDGHFAADGQGVVRGDHLRQAGDLELAVLFQQPRDGVGVQGREAKSVEAGVAVDADDERLSGHGYSCSFSCFPIASPILDQYGEDDMMKRLVPLLDKDDDKVLIYVESDMEAEIPEVSPEQGRQRNARGGVEAAVSEGRLEQVEQTLRAFATRALAPFRDLALANVDKVKLEFGLNIGGQAGIPYITSGKVESTLKVTVECSFPPATRDPKPSEGNTNTTT